VRSENGKGNDFGDVWYWYRIRGVVFTMQCAIEKVIGILYVNAKSSAELSVHLMA
jgi:hypothetical protein